MDMARAKTWPEPWIWWGPKVRYKQVHYSFQSLSLW
jgi:hypothetical protein